MSASFIGLLIIAAVPLFFATIGSVVRWYLHFKKRQRQRAANSEVPA